MRVNTTINNKGDQCYNNEGDQHYDNEGDRCCNSEGDQHGNIWGWSTWHYIMRVISTSINNDQHNSNEGALCYDNEGGDQHNNNDKWCNQLYKHPEPLTNVWCLSCDYYIWHIQLCYIQYQYSMIAIAWTDACSVELLPVIEHTSIFMSSMHHALVPHYHWYQELDKKSTVMIHEWSHAIIIEVEVHNITGIIHALFVLAGSTV